jgi:hypothetical protein
LLASGRGTAGELQFTPRFLFQKLLNTPLPAKLTWKKHPVAAGRGWGWAASIQILICEDYKKRLFAE